MFRSCVTAHLERIGNANAILPMTTVASAGAYLLSTPVELGPKESRQNKLTTSIHGSPGELGLSEIDDQVILADRKSVV